MVLLLSLSYLLIENGCWHSGADTAFYLAIARNLVQGNGFQFNSVPVVNIPPIWPLVLAGAMKISASFWFLNLIPAACLVGAATCWYWVARRFAPPALAFFAVLLSATIFFWYTSAIQLRSEGLFCLLFAAATLLGVQVGEGRAQGWRIALAVALCGLAVGVRWVGLVCWLPVAMAMLTGQLLPRLNRQWIAASLAGIISVSAFVGFRHIVANWPVASPAPTTTKGGSAAPAIQVDPQSVQETDDAFSEDMEGPQGMRMQAVIPQPGLAVTTQRFLSSGKWISALFWMPMYLGVTSATFAIISNPVGWILIGLYLFCLWQQALKRQWLLLGVLLYCGALVFRWRYPNPRYLVPVAPLLLLGAWLGLQWLIQRSQSLGWRRLWRTATTLFIASLVLCNATLWAIDVYIARSDDFYGHYMAGENDKLIAAAKYVNDRGLGDGELAVSYRYLNLGRMRKNGHGLRSMHLLTNRIIRSAPRKVCSEPPDLKMQELLAWAVSHNVKYYLYRPPVSPWRAHHFRIAWWQRFKTGQQDIPINPSWILYEITPEKAIPIELPNLNDWPSHVPGL